MAAQHLACCAHRKVGQCNLTVTITEIIILTTSVEVYFNQVQPRSRSRLLSSALQMNTEQVI